MAIRSMCIMRVSCKHFKIISMLPRTICRSRFFEDTGDAVIGAELDYSVRYGEELDYLSDIVLLTDEEKKLFGPG